MTERTALYRLYDVDDQLLYIGISVNPTTRWSMHAGEKTWWPLVARKDLAWLDNRDDAERAEACAIIKERPRYNVTHSTTRIRGDARQEDTGRYGFVAKVRVSSQLWQGFGQAAKSAGTNRSALIMAFIRWYLRRPGAKPPTRPAAGPWSAQPTA